MNAYSINCHGSLIDLSTPKVMGIVNLTPDSFYAPSRTQEAEDIARRVRQMEADGADFIDVGAYSSRPGAADVSEAEEMGRMRDGLTAVRQATSLPISVDTFRASVARMAVEECGADLVNDISGGDLDPEMFRTVARLGVPYILMHMQGTPQTMQDNPHYTQFLPDVLRHLALRTARLQSLGVADIIIDPGFGFGKTLEQNFELLDHLQDFREFDLPLLVGLSRKSMICKTLDVNPDEALNGTTALNAMALLKGANILRVHDVRPAAETVRLFRALRQGRS